MGDEQALEKWEDKFLNDYLEDDTKFLDSEARWAYEEDQIDYMEEY